MAKPEPRKNIQDAKNEEFSRPRIFDLEERTAKFGENILRFVQRIADGPVTRPLVSQLVRSATSMGANYLEADDAESKKDFIHKMSISRKEARETKHGLRMMAIVMPDIKDEAREYWREAQELSLIFSAIVRRKKELTN